MNENKIQDETILEEEDLIFQWVDEVEKKPVKKSVSFSKIINLCLIETRKELSFASFNMYMSAHHYTSIRGEFQKEYETFVNSNPEYKMNSRDEMTKNICEFVEHCKEITSS